MAYGNWRYVNDKTTGRFVLSGGHYPAEKIVAHQGLPTLDTALGTGHPDDPRLETVITMGTVLTAVKDSGTSSDTDNVRFAPANGYSQTEAAGAVTYDSGGADEFTVPAESPPVGVSTSHYYRPMFHEYDNHAGPYLVGSALVEWPVVSGGGLDGAAPRDWVTFDKSGRPLLVKNKYSGTDAVALDERLIIGRVLETELFATNFDQGLLNYQLFSPREPVVRHVYEIQASGPNQGTIARANLDTTDVLGAARVLLNL